MSVYSKLQTYEITDFILRYHFRGSSQLINSINSNILLQLFKFSFKLSWKVIASAESANVRSSDRRRRFVLNTTLEPEPFI